MGILNSIQGKLALAFACSSIHQVVAQCDQSFNPETQLYNRSEVLSFEHPWKVLHSDDHDDIHDPRSTVFGMDDCAVAPSRNGENAIFVFGGKDKYGASANPRIFWPDMCLCGDTDYDDCTTCPESDKIKGIFTYPLADNYPKHEIPPPREDHSIVSINDEFYIVGGIKQAGYGDFYKFSITTRNFTRLADFPQDSRKDITAARVGEKVYLLGGISLNTKTYKSDVWEYTPSTDTWKLLWDRMADPDCDEATIDATICPPYIEDASALGSDKLNGILLFGGALESGELSGKNWWFNLATKKWTALEMSSSPPPSEDHSFNKVNEDVAYLVGGDLGNELLSSLWRLDMGDTIDEWKWTEIPQSSPSPVIKDHCSAYIAGKLYVFFGEDSVLGGKQNTVSIYDIAETKCPNDCVGKGKCSNIGVCECEEHLYGPNCNNKEVQHKYLTVSLLASTVCIICGTICLLISTFVLLLLFRNRSHSSLRIANVHMLLLCATGCLLTSIVSIIGATLSTTDPKDTIPDAMCWFEPTAYPICFGLVFGSLYARVRTVDRLFDFKAIVKKGKRLSKSFYKRRMTMDVVNVVMLQLALTCVWIGTDTMKLEWQHVQQLSFHTKIYQATCNSESKTTWFTLFIILDGGILARSGYFAWKHRARPEFGDVKTLGLSIYNLLLFLVPTIVITNGLDLTPDAKLVVSTIGISLSTIGVLVFAIIPPLVGKVPMSGRSSTGSFIQRTVVHGSVAGSVAGSVSGRTNVVADEIMALE